MKMIHIHVWLSDGSHLEAYLDELSVGYEEGKLEMHCYDDKGDDILSFNMKTDGIKAFRIGASA